MGAGAAYASDTLGCGSYRASCGRGRRVRSAELAHALPSLPSPANLRSQATVNTGKFCNQCGLKLFVTLCEERDTGAMRDRLGARRPSRARIRVEYVYL